MKLTEYEKSLLNQVKKTLVWGQHLKQRKKEAIKDMRKKTKSQRKFEVKENNSIRNYNDFDYSQMQATKAENARLKSIIKKLIDKIDKHQLIELLLEK